MPRLPPGIAKPRIGATRNLRTISAFSIPRAKACPRMRRKPSSCIALAAAQDDLEGLTNLASMYLEGRGVGRDTAQAFQLFAKAAARGYAVAQNNLALMYANGEAVKRDYVKAYAWLDIAAAEVPKAAEVRDAIAREMTPAQLAQARQLAIQKRKELAEKGGKTQ